MAVVIDPNGSRLGRVTVTDDGRGFVIENKAGRAWPGGRLLPK